MKKYELQEIPYSPEILQEILREKSDMANQVSQINEASETTKSKDKTDTRVTVYFDDIQDVFDLDIIAAQKHRRRGDLMKECIKEHLIKPYKDNKTT